MAAAPGGGGAEKGVIRVYLPPLSGCHNYRVHEVFISIVEFVKIFTELATRGDEFSE